MAVCSVPAATRRKKFWATQPDSCGRNEVCGNECGQPGLLFMASGTSKTISTDAWLRGLIINMLMTDGKSPDTPCGYRPGSQGGHWSESYISNGPASVGTLLRRVPPTGSMNESMALIVAFAQETLGRLVSRGVAEVITVAGKYLGQGRMQLDVTVQGRGNENVNVGVIAKRLANGWVWG